MAFLIVEDGRAEPDATIGGVPFGSPGTQWPMCRSCRAPMQFLAQFPLSQVAVLQKLKDKALLLFECMNDPGMCDEWDPDGGGNAALLVPLVDRKSLSAPSGPTQLARECRVKLVPYDGTEAQDTPDDNYCRALEGNSLTFGKMGGVPLWLQGDETPKCQCGSQMTFVAQLEARGGLSFGDSGAGYAFVCESCGHCAKFLWQSA
jgi:uncharacterized protein YwqG